jgi:hypothetical protein
VRVALLVLLMLLAVAARAQDDDDGTLDQPSLGPGIPERMQELEKEWADDVGKDPSDEPKPEPDDDAAEPADADHDGDEHEATSKPKLPEQLVPKASKPSALTRPPRDEGNEKRDAAKPKAVPADASSPSKPASPPPARTDSDAKGEH